MWLTNNSFSHNFGYQSLATISRRLERLGSADQGRGLDLPFVIMVIFEKYRQRFLIR